MGIAPSGTVTFLFTDIESSTTHWDLDASAMAGAINRHDDIVRHAVDQHDGYLFFSAGDGVAAAFGRATGALAAALDAQLALAAERWPTREPVRVRMGIHTGEAIERDGDYLGTTVNRAARVMGLARGGHVLASLTSQQLLRAVPGVAFVDCGEYALKGPGEPERLFAVGAPGLDIEPPAFPVGGIGLPASLNRLIGRLGACEASGVIRSPQQTIPPPVDALIVGGGDRRLRQMYQAGAQLKLPELIRIATSEQELPDVDE